MGELGSSINWFNKINKWCLQRTLVLELERSTVTMKGSSEQCLEEPTGPRKSGTPRVPNQPSEVGEPSLKSENRVASVCWSEFKW